MGGGVPLPVAEADNHPVHIEAHLTPLKAIIDNYNATGQITPDAIIAIETVIPHVAEHFEYLKADELQKELYQQLWPIFTEIVSAAGAIMQRIQAQADQMAGIPPEEGPPQQEIVPPPPQGEPQPDENAQPPQAPNEDLISFPGGPDELGPPPNIPTG